MSNEATKTVTAEISADGDRVNVEFGYDPQLVKDIKKVTTARFVNKQKSPTGKPFWRVDLDLNTMRRLREVFGDRLEIGEALRAWGREEVAKERNLTDLSQADDAELDNMPAPLIDGVEVGGRKIALRPYQKADIKFMASTNAINANQPGAGKTIETIGSFLEAGLEWGQIVVFAPIQSLRNVWEQEIAQVYEAAGYDAPTILTGDNPAQRREAIAEAKALADDDKAFWLVLNPYMARLRNVRVLDGEELSKAEFGELSPRDQERSTLEERLVSPELAEIDWDGMVIDEFHLMGLSNPSTLGARGVNRIAELTQPLKKFALSGTPMGGKPIKLWGALHFLEPDKFGSRWNWARHWLVVNHNGYGHQIEGIMPGREVDFYNHLKPYLVRRTKREALPGLPPKQRIDVWCSMTPKQGEQYTKFATEAEWELEDAEEQGRLTATNILAAYTRLKQFAGAFCKVHRDAKGDIKCEATTDSGKIEQLLEKLREENVIVTSEDDDEPKRAVVFSQFVPMVAAITEALEAEGVPVATMVAGKTKRNTEIARSFQRMDADSPRVIVMNTMMGTALNLSAADTVHVLDETWVPDNQEQAEDRAHRGDDLTMGKDEVRMYYYRTRGTVEEHIQRLVADKALNNKTILDVRRRMQKELAAAEGEGE